MAGYNITRYVEELLERTESLPPSFSVHLHVEYWTLNNGSKFLYNNQIASLLDDVRAHRIPVDFLDLFEAAKVPFYDGCMIVELLDYRPQRNREPTLEKPERTRAVLHPNSETLWADICAMNQRHGGKWSDRHALEIEARLLLATVPPLCLEPDPHLARIANHVTRVSTPTVPVSLKRKATAMDPEEDETDKARRAKIMQFMNPRQNRTVTPSYRILDAIQRSREKRDTCPEPTAVPATATVLPSSAAPSPTKPPTPSITVSQTHSPADSEDKKKTKTMTTVATTAFARANGSMTPVPPATTHQFISQNPPNPSTPNAHSPLQPQVYPSVQAATEAARRTPTPAQLRNYAPSPRPPTSKTPAPVQPGQNIPPQISAFQAQVPTSHFLSQPPTRGAAGKAATTANGTKAVPQISPAALAQAQAMYAQQLQQGHQVQQQQLQQRINAQKNGRATPQIQAAKSPAARNSPMVANKPLAARSPMPPTTQLPAQQQQGQGQQPQQPQPAQHPQHTFTPTYNPAHLRPLVHVNPQLPAHLSGATATTTANGQSHAPNSNTNTNPNTTTTASPQQPQAQAQVQPQQPQPPQQSQPQQQPQQQQPLHMYTPQMYYPPMNYTPTMQAHAQRLYWQQQQQQQHGAMAAAAARGMPGMVNVNVNGQPGMMSGTHAQQVQMAAAKAGSAGIQGR